ncbi:MAG: 2-C-methyl-D-erythritol 4-phosphate cytidylyltransferase [Candidatus Goldiibacteriota bacterium HGW-Goldbacteria-1]|jgi:2-C-methyl-D-erythritol 4-phosphate cytidylyltransferase|nr:MAG: 2-C-methyl-D-erythritol 4-phosphate cytidylyltransferase [Candidatus Goldiibacteriota bacterium HGW-Goldbacteria-1]
MKTAAIIVAAGSGKRFGGAVPKQYLKLKGREILAHAVSVFEKSREIGLILLVVSPDYREFAGKMIVKKYGFKKVAGVIDGGAQRYDSVYNALKFLKKMAVDNVLIHDGARPYFEPGLITDVLRELKKYPAAIPVKKVSLTVKKVKGGFLNGTLDRNELRTAETPQGFRYKEILKAYETADFNKLKPTDDAQLFEARGKKVKAVEYEGINIKVTTKQDLEILKGLPYFKKLKG